MTPEPRYVDCRSSDEFCPQCNEDFPCTCVDASEHGENIEVADASEADDDGAVNVAFEFEKLINTARMSIAQRVEAWAN